MNALAQFKERTKLPGTFGVDRESSYARLAYVDTSDQAGADADVEFDVDSSRIRVTVTEWQRGQFGVDRGDVTRVEFDAVTGVLMGEDDETLSRLLVAVDGMRLLGGEAES